MNTMELTTDMKHALGEFSTAIFDLRDALVELSLYLKDHQFEADVHQRRKTADAVQHLLKRMASSRDASA